ncbi:MAG: site-specific integrase [Bacteroidales bacterium]
MAQINVKFILKPVKSDGRSLIMMRAFYYSNDFRYSTGLQIRPEYWDDMFQVPITEAYERIKRLSKTDPEQREKQKIYHRTISDYVKSNLRLKGELDFIHSECRRFEAELNKAFEYHSVHDIIPTKERMAEWLNEKIKKQPKARKKQESFFDVYDKFISTTQTQKGPRTIQKFQTSRRKLMDFQALTHSPVSFSGITMEFYDDFQNYLIELGHLNSTIGKEISNLKTFLNWAFERGYHSNSIYRRRGFSTGSKPKYSNIVLTVDEIFQLEQVDLANNSRLDRIRDIFLFCYYTGQRISDVLSFDLQDVVDGYWILRQEKTKKEVRVPILDPTTKMPINAKLAQIIEKYGSGFPSISSQKFNQYLKELGLVAEITAPCLKVRDSGNQDILRRNPKYMFMTSHIARRSRITHLLERGESMTTIMKLVGHSDVRTLMKYENTGEKAVKELLLRDN